MLWVILIIIGVVGLIGLLIILYPYFLRDPERVIPEGNCIVSPADGRVLYVKHLEAGEVPMTIKGREKVPIEEFTKLEMPPDLREGVLIGIYLSFTDVHVNRSPVAGQIARIRHDKGRTISMLPLLSKNAPTQPTFCRERSRISRCICGVRSTK